MADAHKNFARSLIVTAPSPATSGTSLVVQTGDGALFPTPPFNATLFPVGTDPLTATAEIVRVTAIATDTFTITRAQETSFGGGTAKTVVAGWQIIAGITAKTLQDAESFVIKGDQAVYTPTNGLLTYWGAYPSFGNNPTADRSRMVILKAGVITRIDVATYTATAATGTQTATLTLRKNGSDVATLTSTKLYNQGNNTQTIASYTGLSVTVAVGDTLEFKEQMPTWTSAPVNVAQAAFILVAGS